MIHGMNVHLRRFIAAWQIKTRINIRKGPTRNLWRNFGEHIFFNFIRDALQEFKPGHVIGNRIDEGREFCFVRRGTGL